MRIPFCLPSFRPLSVAQLPCPGRYLMPSYKLPGLIRNSSGKIWNRIKAKY